MQMTSSSRFQVAMPSKENRQFSTFSQHESEKSPQSKFSYDPYTDQLQANPSFGWDKIFDLKIALKTFPT